MVQSMGITTTQLNELRGFLLAAGADANTISCALEKKRQVQVWNAYRLRKDFKLIFRDGGSLDLYFSKRPDDTVKSDKPYNKPRLTRPDDDYLETALKPDKLEKPIKHHSRARLQDTKVSFTFRLDEDILEDLTRIARHEERSVGSLIRYAIKQYCKDYDWD